MTYEYNSILSSVVIGLMLILMLMNFNKPTNMYLSFITPVLVFTGTLYGLEGTVNKTLADSDVFTFYSRGAGQIGLGFINLILIALFFYLIVLQRRNRLPREINYPVTSLAVLIAIYFIVYIAFGTLFMDVAVRNAIGTYGMFNFLNLTIMLVVTRRALGEPAAPISFMTVFLYAGLFMAVFGLVRLPFGGDPANFYNSYEQKGLAITYFDIGQNALFAIILCFVLLDRNFAARRNLMPMLVASLMAAAIILSFRRTAWIGLGLMGVWVFFLADHRLRRLIALAATIATVAIIAVSSLRFESGAGSGSFLSDIMDSSGNISTSTGRFSELAQAIEATSDNLLFGLGPWHYNEEFSYDHTGDPTSFVHSSVVHVFLKMGLLGLIPYVALLILYPVWWIRNRRRRWENPTLRAMGDAFFGGFLFFLPDILFGTPLISFRHSLILGLCFATPIAMVTADRSAQASLSESSLISRSTSRRRFVPQSARFGGAERPSQAGPT